MIVKVIRLHKNEQNEEEPKKKGKKKRKVRIKKTNRVGIDLGSGKNYATVYFSRKNKIKTYKNFLFKRKIHRLVEEFEFLNAKKVLTTDEIQRANKIQNKIKKECHKMIKNIIIDIVVFNNPDIINIENINVEEMKRCNYNNSKIKNAKRFNNLIDMCDFKYFTKYITKMCKIHKIKLVIADNKFPSTKLCHHCGGWNYVTDEKEFNCIHCGKKIKRDENSAKVLSRYDVHEYEKYLDNKSKKYYK